MERNQDDAPTGGQDGINRVVNGEGKYAYFTESVQAEYAVAQYCGLRVIGGFSGLGTVAYSVGLRKGEVWFGRSLFKDICLAGSPYRTPINHAILRLEYTDVLQSLKRKWWKENVPKKPNCEVTWNEVEYEDAFSSIETLKNRNSLKI